MHIILQLTHARVCKVKFLLSTLLKQTAVKENPL